VIDQPDRQKPVERLAGVFEVGPPDAQALHLADERAVGLGVGASLGLGESCLGLQLFFDVEVELRVVGEAVEGRFERVTLPAVGAAGAGSDLLDDLE